MTGLPVNVTQGNLNNGHFYIRRDCDFFPSSTWGGKDASQQGQPVVLEFDGTGERVNTDIDGSKRIFRNARGQIKRFFEYHDVTAQTTIYVVKLGEGHYRVTTNSTREVLEDESTTRRAEAFGTRVIRDTKVTAEVKKIYRNKCQICGESIKTKDGWYSEGAHIQGLGTPHSGPDIIENILCLCPNHHVMFDKGGVTINSDFSLNGMDGKLTVSSEHNIGQKYIEYHRESNK